MNQITTRYVTENGACYEQYVITDAEAKTELVITPERGGMITGFSLNGCGERRPGRRDPDLGVHPADQVPLSLRFHRADEL